MNNAQVLFGGLLILLGLGFLFDVNIFEYLIPALLIFLGWQLLNGGRGKTETGVVEAERLSSEEINDVQIFTSENRVLESDAFEGGRYVVIFAGSTLDLREVKTVDENISLEVVALFGGVTVRVPHSWKVKSEVVAILGGFDNMTTFDKSEDQTVLSLKGFSIFGSVEITN